MNYKIYILIFITKIIENSLSTLRLIVVSNGKKIIGSILNGIISIIWIIGTGMVLIGIQDDYLKILFFCLGSIIGSYLGSIMEEKIALGNNLIMAVVNQELKETIINELTKEKFTVTILNSHDDINPKGVILVMIPRKKTHECVSLISCIDPTCTIISESIINIKSELKHNT